MPQKKMCGTTVVRPESEGISSQGGSNLWIQNEVIEGWRNLMR